MKSFARHDKLISMNNISYNVQRAADAISSAGALLFTAGAGMGVDSGLPDFRGNTGFWKAYPAYEKLGVSFVDLANPDWFIKDPSLAWGFYGHRMGLYRGTRPHRGFQILRKWDNQVGNSFVYTSNVDGQFQKAGFDPQRIVECHGALSHMQCTRECGVGLFDSFPYEVHIHPTSFRAQGRLPECPQCGSLARPNVLMFGDYGFDEIRVDSQMAAYSDFLTTLTGPLVIVESGAGTHIPSVRSQGEKLLRQFPGSTLVRLNPRESQGPEGTISLPTTALKGLEAIDSVLDSKWF